MDETDIGENFYFGFRVAEVQHFVRNPTPITSCGNTNGKCTISRGHTTSASISGGVGVTVRSINAELGRTYEEEFTDTVGCEADLRAGQRLVMYPTGDFVFFEQGWEKGTAFLPTGVQCIVESDW